MAKLTLETEKVQFFTGLNHTILQDIKKIILGGSFEFKNLLIFNCTTENFHIPHHTSIGTLMEKQFADPDF